MILNNIVLKQDSVKIANKVLNYNSNFISIHNIGMWIAIAEFLFIIYLLFKYQKEISKHSSKSKLKDEAMKGDVDFENIINSSFNSTQLYDELKVKCHPDRFISDEEKNKIANSLSKELSKNKTNFKKLLELKQEAEQKLNINL
jgi:hypothetical protein